MKKGVLVSFCICFTTMLIAQQNLVPNYSFEQELQCITYCDDFNGYIADWTGQGGGGKYLSWFTALCNTHGVAGVPINTAGHQYARSGNSYASICSYLSKYDTFGIPFFRNFRNYIQVQLTDSLKAGVTYCVTWYVSLADTSVYSCSDMGAYLSDSLLYEDPYCKVKSNFVPQIANDPIGNPLTNKVAWTKITGDYIASGGEKYIVIGNFKNDSSSSIDSVGSGANVNTFPDAYAALYYIDDVYVMQINQAHPGKDTLICAGDVTTIGEANALPGVRYQWQPTNGLATPNSAQTLASPTITTTYTLTAISDSLKNCGCPDSVSMDSVTVSIEQCPDYNTVSIFVPTAFSPNQTINNILYVRSNSIASMDFNIFDRWGNKVFESQNINIGWDGSYNGTPMDIGTYVWELGATLIDGTKIEKKGSVTLLR